MNKNLILAMLAGLFFGAWPLLMNRSGLSGYVAAMTFSLFVLIIVSPFGLSEGTQSFYTADWKFVVAYGIAGGIGLLLFTKMVASVTAEQISSLFIITLVAQILVPAVYDIYLTGSFSFQKVIGFIAAIVTVLCLKQS